MQSEAEEIGHELKFRTFRVIDNLANFLVLCSYAVYNLEPLDYLDYSKVN